eukprot:RCo042680
MSPSIGTSWLQQSMPFLRLLLLLAALLLRPTQGRVHTLTAEARHPHVVSLGAQDELHVTLPSNPSTGYRWVPTFNTSVLHLVHSDCAYLEPATSSTSANPRWRVGRPCELSLWFVSGSSQELTELGLRHLRPWEGAEGAVLSTLRFQVRTVGEYRGSRKFPTPTAAVAHARKRLIERAADVKLPAGVPAVLDPTGWVGYPPAQDQGTCGACWAFATAGALAVPVGLRLKQYANLSAQYLVSCNTDGWGCGGGNNANKYFYDYAPSGELVPGAVLEADFPYEADDVPCNSPHPHVLSLSQMDLPITTDPADLMVALYTYQSVDIALDGSMLSSYDPNSELVIAVSTDVINHEVVLVGYNTLNDPPYWVVRNSWGVDWGLKG